MEKWPKLGKKAYHDSCQDESSVQGFALEGSLLLFLGHCGNRSLVFTQPCHFLAMLLVIGPVFSLARRRTVADNFAVRACFQILRTETFVTTVVALTFSCVHVSLRGVLQSNDVRFS
jgi:hypothetical protein